MAKIHDLFIVELAEVIKGYGNNPDDKDPFRLSEFYRFYELPNIAVSRENFEKMRPIEPQHKTGKWISVGERCGEPIWQCSECKVKEAVPTATSFITGISYALWHYCPNCGVKMEEEQND